MFPLFSATCAIATQNGHENSSQRKHVLVINVRIHTTSIEDCQSPGIGSLRNSLLTWSAEFYVETQRCGVATITFVEHIEHRVYLQLAVLDPPWFFSELIWKSSNEMESTVTSVDGQQEKTKKFKAPKF